jgi:hypothetical protein
MNALAYENISGLVYHRRNPIPYNSTEFSVSAIAILRPWVATSVAFRIIPTRTEISLAEIGLAQIDVGQPPQSGQRSDTIPREESLACGTSLNSSIYQDPVVLLVGAHDARTSR